jgi:hypothetical protein
MTSPISASATTGATVTCAQTATRYVASAVNSLVAGYRHSWTVRIAGYHGPGSYPALVTYAIVGPGGGIASASGVPATPVTISGTGGSLAIDATGRDGLTLAETISWTCP